MVINMIIGGLALIGGASPDLPANNGVQTSPRQIVRRITAYKEDDKKDK